MKTILVILLIILFASQVSSEETLPPLKDGKAPETLDELWWGFDPRKEPLDVEVLHEWEQDGVVLKVIRYRVGVFKGKKAMMAAVYGYPKGVRKVPGLVEIHGGGGWGSDLPVLANAKEGYATISIAWDGRIRSSEYPIDNQAKQLFWDNKKDDPNYRLTTDWGDLEGFFYPRRYEDRNAPEHLLDQVDSQRNSPWFLWTIGARRAITFLEQQPEVDAERIGVYGHSMGGELTVTVAGSDSRVKAASPSCGGITYENPDDLLSGMRTHSRISCPILFMMPSNDFNGRIHGLPPAVEKLQSKEWRVVSAPHRSHRVDPQYYVSVTLWFNQFLKDEFRMPQNPDTMLVLDTPDKTPVFSVTPDDSRQILSVDVYYTQQAQTNYTDRVTAMTKYWRHAPSVEKEGTWTAALPVFSTDRQLWVYADIAYALDREVYCSGRGQIFQSDKFNLASLLKMVGADELKTAGVKPTEKPSLLIEDFQEDWEKEWVEYVAGRRKTFKLQDPQYQAPPNSRLGIEVQSDKKGTMQLSLEKEKNSYRHTIEIEGNSEWHKVVLFPSDFKKTNGEMPKDWDDLDIVIWLPAGWEWGDLHMRNLRWIEPDIVSMD